MLIAVENGPAIVVCNTCRHSAEARENEQGTRGGAQLAEQVRAMRDADPRYSAIAVQDMACLFACTEFCTVHIRAPGKVSYVLGRFTPDAQAAQAILDYALAYASSEHGRVPFKEWPQGVKGHFITRSPPAGFVAQ